MTRISPLLIWLFYIAAAALWLALQYDIGPNTNGIWLTIAAGRMLDGGNILTSYYESNPPYNIAYHIPAALLLKYLPLSMHDILLIYAAFISLCLFACTARLLRGFTTIDLQTRRAFLAFYFIASFFIPGHFFGDRDHIVAMALVPLCLALLSFRQSPAPSGIFLSAVIAFTALLTLLKPHFMILPAAIALADAIKQRKPFVVLEFRYLIVAAATLFYAAFIAIGFPEYVKIIAPDFVQLYVIYLQDPFIIPYGIGMAAIALTGILCAASLNTSTRVIPTMLFFAALIGAASFLMQGKGFYYHLIPFFIFFSMGVSMLLLQGLEELVPGKKSLPAITAIAFTVIFSGILHMDKISPYLYPGLYENAQPNYRWPRHSELEKTELVQLVKKYAAGQNYFMLYNMPTIMLPAAYSNSGYGTRFSSYWFLPALAQMPPGPRADEYRKKYGTMAGEDFRRYKPAIVILGQLELTFEKGTIFDYPAFFSIAPVFREEWKNYRKLETITLDSRDYFGGYHFGTAADPVKFDVYLRKDAVEAP